MAVKRCEEGTALSDVLKVVIWDCGQSIQLLFFEYLICALPSMHITSLNSQNSPTSLALSSFYGGGKRGLPQGHAARKWQSWNVNQDSSVSQTCARLVTTVASTFVLRKN